MRNVVQKLWGLTCELLRSTIFYTSVFMVLLFVSHIRSIMDFCSHVWNVVYLGDIRLLEGVQRRNVGEIANVSHTYMERLKVLDFFSIFDHLVRADLIKYYKTFRSEIGYLEGFLVAGYQRICGHSFRIVVQGVYWR